MKKRLLLFLGVVTAITLITGGLNAIPVKKQQQRVTLHLTVQEVELIMKALGKLPLEESGNLYIGIQQQAQTQLAPQKPKVDSAAPKSKKP
jgi:hypothetical protein